MKVFKFLSNIGVVILIMFGTSCNEYYYGNLPRQKNTVGEMIDTYVFLPKNSGYSIIEYNINGIKYRDHNRTDRCFVKGEKFLVVYDSINPKHYFVNMNVSLILDNEKVDTTSGTISYLNNLTEQILFDYKVNNIEYCKNQGYEADTGVSRKYLTKQYFSTNNIKVGDKFLVKYVVDNPGRSVMYLNKRVVGDTLK